MGDTASGYQPVKMIESLSLGFRRALCVTSSKVVLAARLNAISKHLNVSTCLRTQDSRREVARNLTF
jgi:hypothetical protein